MWGAGTGYPPYLWPGVPQFPLFGFDYHELSIQWARKRAEEGGVSDRVCFETVSAKDMPGDTYDLITMFDCLHDMGDPVGVARHMRKAITTTAPG